MKKIKVEITGIAPLLQHRFPIEERGENENKAKKKVYIPEKEAERGLYRNKEGKIVQPSEHIYQAMVKAATNFKFEGKKTYKDLIKANVIVEPEYIDLNKGSWDEIDARAVVIQRNRVICWRPRFNEWKLNFEVIINDEENISTKVVKDILEKAGTNGIGDYRPRFGRFIVSEFKEK